MHSTKHEPALHPEPVDRWRSAGHRAEQPSEQRNGRVASDSGALGTKNTFQVSKNAASNLVPEVGHSWRRRDRVDNSMEEANAGLRTAEW